MIRQQGEAAYNTLKTATKMLVRDIGGVDATAACTRAGRSLISDYGNLASDRFMPGDIILDAETIGGTPHITAALARIQGYELVPRTTVTDGDLNHKLAGLGREFGALFADVATALADGEITEAERDTLLRGLENVRRVAGEAASALLAPTPGKGCRKK
jgi:hypothetical protein